MSAETIDLLGKVVVPIITAVIGLFGGMHIERKKTKNVVNLKDNAQANDINQGVTVQNNYNR